MIQLPNIKDDGIFDVKRCHTWPLATEPERHRSHTNPVSSGSGVCQVHVDDLDTLGHLKWHKPSIFRQPSCSPVTLWVHSAEFQPRSPPPWGLRQATVLLWKKALPGSWLLFWAWWWLFAVTAWSHGKGVRSAPQRSHTGYLCFPVSLSANISLLERHVEQMAVKEKNTEATISGRDVVALEKISDNRLRPELVVMLVFVAWQSSNSRR